MKLPPGLLAAKHLEKLVEQRYGRDVETSVTYSNTIVLVTSFLALGCCAVGPASARTFGGYDCTYDCVVHAAGMPREQVRSFL